MRFPGLRHSGTDQLAHRRHRRVGTQREQHHAQNQHGRAGQKNNQRSGWNRHNGEAQDENNDADRQHRAERFGKFGTNGMRK